MPRSALSTLFLPCAALGLVSAPALPAAAQQAEMSFFVTSTGTGQGGNLGGLEGADAHCTRLAESAGVKGKTWRAYLSTQATADKQAVNARDRIGPGPWKNAKGDTIARSVEELHGPSNNLTKATALDELGMGIKGRGDTPNEHDILTGSQPDGTAYPPGEDKTCGNWTRSGTEGAAVVGHHDRTGLDESPPAKSWNSSHLSRGGCSLQALRGTGGAGLLYCFAER